MPLVLLLETMTTLDSIANDFIRRMVAYIGDAGTSAHYESWMSQWSADPAFATSVAREARKIIGNNDDFKIVRSAMQALAVTGEAMDLVLLDSLRTHADSSIRADVDDCKRIIVIRMKTLEDLLDEVVDWKTFATFVEKLAAEREKAQEIEEANKGNPAYIVNGALGWNNGDIQGFLWASLSFFPDNLTEDDGRAQPTWRNFAEMLYYGKTTE